MVRAAAQVLIGFMLSFGVITLAPRVIFHMRKKNAPRALYLSVVCLIMLFFAVLSFHYTYTAITE